MWKAGCVTALLGLFVAIASFFLFGAAIKKAATSRQVANERIEPGVWSEVGKVSVDSESLARVGLTMQIELSEEVVQAAGDNGAIEQYSVPVSYEVRDGMGELVYNETGDATGSLIIPRTDSSHYDSFDRLGDASFQGKPFEVGSSEALYVAAEVAEFGDGGNSTRNPRVVVHDQIAGDTSRWAIGGVLAVFVGPFIAFVGFVLFVIGLMTRKKDPPSRPRGIPPVPQG